MLQINLAFFRFLHARFSAAALRNVLPVFISTIQNEFDLPFPPPRRFRFRLPFSSFFVVFIPRADWGVVYMRMLEKFGRFGGFVATGLGRSEYVRQRRVRQI